MCLNAGTCCVHFSLAFFPHSMLIFFCCVFNVETGLTNLQPGKRNVNQFTLAVEVVKAVLAIQIEYTLCGARVCIVSRFVHFTDGKKEWTNKLSWPVYSMH